jgi:hypothetical protein
VAHSPLQFAQVDQDAQPPKMNAQASALRFVFTITLGPADLVHQLAAHNIGGSCRAAVHIRSPG